jgi:hypothetical protein
MQIKNKKIAATACLGNPLRQPAACQVISGVAVCIISQKGCQWSKFFPILVNGLPPTMNILMDFVSGLVSL